MWQFVLCHCFCCVKWNPEPLAGCCLTVSAKILASVFAVIIKSWAAKYSPVNRINETEPNTTQTISDCNGARVLDPTTTTTATKIIQTILRRKTNFTSGCKQIQKPDADTISFVIYRTYFRKEKKNKIFELKFRIIDNQNEKFNFRKKNELEIV